MTVTLHTMRKIGRYEMFEELGRGAMGIVYRAFDPSIGRALAVKLIRTPEFASPEEIAEAEIRLVREASAAGRLSHPNIVTVYDLGQERDFEYIAMELVPGASLDMLLKTGKRFSREEIIQIVRQVGGALDYANANGVVHRDIKPGNILVRPDGVVKVTDFGIARIASQTITKTGTSMGTPAYMAPEQIKGSRVDARADQYSLGVVAYQLLGGKLPFVASSDHALMYQIVNDVPASLLGANPQLPAEADRAIRRALAKHPDQRFDSCGEFSAALEVALTVRPIPHPDGNESEATVRTAPRGTIADAGAEAPATASWNSLQ